MDKSDIKFIIPVLGLILLSSIFVQSQNSAQDQNLVSQGIVKGVTELRSASCDTKIPIGESVDRTSDLLDDIYLELENIYRLIPEQIEGAQEAIEAAQKCNLDHCQPVCVDISCYKEDFGCGSTCIAKCVEKTCRGKICPDLEIPNRLVKETFEDINNSFEKIKTLYGGDREELIQKKLDQARIEFSNCAKTAETRTVRCRDIFDQNSQFPLEKIEECKSVCGEEKTTEKCLECLCGSSINYFCCH